MRVVSGYYHMTAWRYRSQTHSVIVIASELADAKEAVTMFLKERGYATSSVNLHGTWKKVRNISSTATVIVAVTDIVITKV
jgi:hypothetical protein